MRLIYVAEDGAEFDNERDCKAYECNLSEILNNPPTLFDQDLRRLDEHKFYDLEAYEDRVNKAYYIVIRTEEQLRSFRKFCDEMCIDNSKIDRCGIYFYEECNGTWEDYTALWVEQERIHTILQESYYSNS